MMKSHSSSKDSRTGYGIKSGLPCSHCGSSDAVTEYSDNNTHCFSCGVTVFASKSKSTNRIGEDKMSEDLNVIKADKKLEVFIPCEYKTRELPPRGLSLESCEKWDYGIGRAINPITGENEYCHVANFISQQGEVIGQKLRFQYIDENGETCKTFATRGKINFLYGKHLWQSGKKIIITEGEIDAISVSQILEHKYPVVSLPNGVDSAKRTLIQEKEWLSKNFEDIILMFDNDEKGTKYLADCAKIFAPGKVKIAELSLKDANEMLLAGKEKEVKNAIWLAKPYQSAGIITAREVLTSPIQTIPQGDSFPWPEVTTWNKGMRSHEMYAYGAGTGVSKTDTTKDIMAYLLGHTKKKVGLIYLEEPETIYTISSIASKMCNLNFVNIGTDEIEKQNLVRKQAEEIQDRAVLYRPTGDNLDEVAICDVIRDMVVIHNCSHIVLDHVTYLVDGKDNQLTYMQKVMSSLNRINKELPFTLHYISHLRKSSTGSHEEGARVTVDDFVGGKAVVQYSHLIFGLEGDRQHEIEELRNLTVVRLLKCRLFGFNTGKKVDLVYNIDEGRKYQATEKQSEYFQMLIKKHKKGNAPEKEQGYAARNGGNNG